MAEKQKLQTVSECSDWLIQIHIGQLESLAARLANRDSRKKFADELIGRYPEKLGHLDPRTVVDAVKVTAENSELAPRVQAWIAGREERRAIEQERREAAFAPISPWAAMASVS